MYDLEQLHWKLQFRFLLKQNLGAVSAHNFTGEHDLFQQQNLVLGTTSLKFFAKLPM